MRAGTINRILIVVLIGVCVLWLVIPFAMAILWSIVDPSQAWSYPDLFPARVSFQRWVDVWQNTALKDALVNSYTLAPSVAITTLLLATPTAYAIGRFEFPGKTAVQVLSLLPLVVPGFVIAVFMASLLLNLGLYNRFASIMLGHCVLFLPYAIRILSVSFGLVRQDLIDAARDLGASPWARFHAVYWPALKPGVLAALIIVFIQSIEEFALAFILGSPDFTTVPTILYSFLGFNFVRSNAAVVSLILVVPNVALMLVLERLLKSANPAMVSGKG